MTTTTPTTTLTDRYVDAILRRLPERQRPDIEKELRASIADAVDDRLEAGTDPAEAERRGAHRTWRPGPAGRRVRGSTHSTSSGPSSISTTCDC